MDRGAGTPQDGGAAQQLTDRQRTLAFVTVLIAFVLEVADTTIVNTALPEIRRALDASSAAMQWIVAGYLLVLGALLLLGGRLGDAFGYRRMFLIGVAGFIATSALCGFAQTPEQLVIGRLLQGAAGAMMGPQVMAIVQTLFSPLERVARLAWFGVIGGLAAILGPILGGLLIEGAGLGGQHAPARVNGAGRYGFDVAHWALRSPAVLAGVIGSWPNGSGERAPWPCGQTRASRTMPTFRLMASG